MITGEPDDEIIWTEFDYAVLNAVQVLDDMIEPTSGLPIWVLTDPRVRISVTSRINKVKKALEDFEKSRGDKGLAPGEEMIVKPYIPGSKELPTLREWTNNGGFEQKMTDESTEEFPENGSEMSKFVDAALPPLKKPEDLKKGWVNPDL